MKNNDVLHEKYDLCKRLNFGENGAKQRCNENHLHGVFDGKTM